MSLSSSHPTHMDHYIPSVRNWCVFSIPPHEDQCETLPGRKCIYQLATLPIWTILDLVWEINVSSQSHPLRTNMQLWQVENLFIIQSPYPHGPSVRNISVFSIPPPEGQCATLSSGECLYHPATLPTWTIKDIVWEIDVSSKSYPMRTSVQLLLVENVSII